jgi:hypothetical protein
MTTSTTSGRTGAVPVRETSTTGAGHFTEAKNGFKTSEMYVAVVFIVAILIATYINSSDSLGHSQGWLYAGIVAAAYIISRGLAKLGVREPNRDR